MPPKKAAGPSKKAEQKRKEKTIEDKTFGLKNKNKSAKVQKYVAEVTHQVKGATTRADRIKADATAKARKAKEAEDAMKNLMLASITQPKVPPGVDPKSILCEFFKAGACTKGTRCKFAHDLNVAKKANKIDLYSDAREQDTMDKWDQQKLEEVAAKKDGKGAVTTTDIVCKHFLDAIEKSLYGWFWTCPNGGAACKYRHALPPGYVYMSKKDRDAEKDKKKDDEVSIEEIIEQQRAKLGANGGTPVTAESLAAYKKEKMERKKKEEEKKQKELMKKTGGKGIMSGRALFTFDPTLFRDDADADDDKYSVHSFNEDEEDENEEKAPAANASADVVDKSLYLQDVDDLDSLKE